MKSSISSASWSGVLVWMAAMFAVASAAFAGTIPEAERWATITHPGNAPYPMPPPPTTQYPYPPGRVDYEYQISRTETTGSEWFEFVQAYAPYVTGDDQSSSSFTSEWVRPTQTAPGVWSYSLRSGGANRAIRVSWRFAARFCNWLHNEKRSDQAAFERGVYDTSTFGGDSQGGYTDQHTRSSGATYFLPTIDEWVKAAYWDPSRVDPITGDLGYWQYPNASDTQLVPGVPGVGQTSAGQFGSFEVGSYVDTQSPWGLWDLSGGQREWLETAGVRQNGLISGRFVKGTYAPSSNPEIVLAMDRIEWLGAGSPFVDNGVRLARIVPTPSALWAFISVPVLVVIQRRRRQP